MNSPGWFLPQANLLILEAAEGLSLRDAAGDELGFVQGASAEALRDLCQGERDELPLLSALVRHAPKLQALTEEQPLPIHPGPFSSEGVVDCSL